MSWIRSAFVVLVALGFTVCGHAAAPQAQAPAASPPPQAAPPSSDAIPVTEIAAQAAATTELLRELASRFAPSVEVEAIQRALPEARKLIELESEATADLLRGQPSLAAIAKQQELWKARQLQTDRWLSALTRRTTDLQAEMGRLTDLQARWRRAQAAAQAAKAPAPVLQQVADLVAGLAAAQAQLQAELTIALDLQSRVAQEAARCSAVLAQIVRAQGQAMGGLFVRDSLPIWNAEGWAEGHAVVRGRARDALASRWDALVQYARDPFQGWPLHVGSFLLLAGLFCAARRRAPAWTAAGQPLSSATAALGHPYSAALIVPLVLASGFTSAVPPTLRQFFEICALVPAIRLARPMLDRRVAPWLYTLGFLFLVDVARQHLAGVPAFEQAVLIAEMLAGGGALGYALTRGRLHRAGLDAHGASPLFRVARRTAPLVLGAFGVALIAGVLGYLRVGRLLAAGILSSGALALMFYACVLVGNGLVGVALQVWPLRLLQMVQRHRDLLARRTGTVLRWGAGVGWTVRTLNYVGLLQPVLAAGAAVLAARLERGAVSLSLGDVVEFVLVVWLAYLVSAFVRFVLEEDVFPRVRLPRGFSYALSRVLTYVLITFGFLLGLGVLGLDLTKLTILVGAFSVGIGFGLQSVVNNFVSGLILLFERPIHVGDVIHMGDLAGEVRRIGIRASVVRTWQGAEVIVPNAQLITERVTNWTFSDRRRRIDLPVGVNYGAPLEQVTQLLESVAQAHPRVLRDPAPEACFMRFGDSAIHFELRVWIDDFAQWVQIHTELAAVVYRALQGAGMHIAFPQREVRLVGGPESAPKIVAQVTPPGGPEGGGDPAGPAASGGARPVESK